MNDDFESTLRAQFAKQHEPFDDDDFSVTISSKITHLHSKKHYARYGSYIFIFISLLGIFKLVVQPLSTLLNSQLIASPGFLIPGVSASSVLFGIVLMSLSPLWFLFNSQST